MNRHRLTAYLLLLLVSVIWGVAGPVIKFTLHDFPPAIFLTYRFAVSSLAALITFILFPMHRPKKIKKIEHILLYGFLTSTVSLGLLFLGFAKTSSLMGTLLSVLSPIMVLTAGAIFFREHITNKEKIGAAIALSGAVISVLEPLIANGNTLFTASFEGNLFIIASLLVGVATSVLAKILSREKISSLFLTHIAFIIGFLTMLPIVLTQYSGQTIWQTLINAPLAAHLGVWYMGLFSGTLAYTLWHQGQKSIEVGEAGLFSYLLPIWAAPLSLLWLHETITPTFLIGAAIIAVGVFIAEFRKKKKGLSKKFSR